MRKTLLAAAACVLVVSSIPTFAADNGKAGGQQGQGQAPQAQQSNGTGSNNNCADILANPESYSRDQVSNCKQ
jgi:hypothetical protein